MTGRVSSKDTPLTVSTTEAGMRLDLFVAAHVPALSRSHIQRLIKTGDVRVDGSTGKPSLPLAAGARVDVRVPPPTSAEPRAEALPLTIVFDDADLTVIDKPAGMVVHPAAGHASGTLVNALLHHVRGLSGIGGVERPGIVHRLDRGTSGLMVIAKHDQSHRHLAAQFHDRTVVKEYVALVWGRPEPGLVMSEPIGRDPRHRQKMSVRSPRGRAAVTTVVSVDAYEGVSLVRLRIGTGRTHQIRVHLLAAGFPITGDAVYGGVRPRVPPGCAAVARLTRPFLHAAHLAFSHPTTGRPLTFDAPLPADLQSVLDEVARTSRARSQGRTRR
jgi:23S rRNA pseudouridine1911/1915/1917 synthase